MSDDTPAIENDSDPITLTIEGGETQPAAPKARRGRKPRAQQAATPEFQPVDVILSEPEAKAKPTTRRTKKLKGEHVTAGVCQVGALVSIYTGHKHWQINPAEVTPWANDAAALLDRIPTRYVDSVLSLSGFVTVGFGIYSVLAPRIEESKKLIERQASDARAASYDHPRMEPDSAQGGSSLDSIFREPYTGTP